MPETSLTLVRRFRASPARVFAARIMAGSLGRWFGPHDFAVTEIAPSPGPGRGAGEA